MLKNWDSGTENEHYDCDFQKLRNKQNIFERN
jgi:hypothetical protein